MSSFIPEPVSKRIIICCDGTWQSAVSGVKGSPSNITRLAQCLKRVDVDDHGKTWQQIVWYDSGVGTTSSKIGKMVEGAVGGGLEGNVIEAYNFVALNWCRGDRIFCFGFSRGAYTARTIAGLISDIGICEPRNMNDFPDIWRQYKTMDSERFYGSDAHFAWTDGKAAEKQPQDLGYKNRNFIWEKHPHGDWAQTSESREIELVGVFDTVGAIGMPSMHGFEARLPWKEDDPKFHNVKLNRNIKRAFQALALDEHREAFAPTLYHLPEGISASDAQLEEQRQKVQAAEADFYAHRYDQETPQEKRQAIHDKYNEARRELVRIQESRKPQSELLQVWFPGVHINNGGGSSDTLKNEGDMEEMANITFAWMLDQIRPYLAINETVIHQEYRNRQIYIDELNEIVRKYQEDKRKQEEAHVEETYAQSFRRLASNAASYVTHPLSKKGPDLRRRDYGWGTGTIIDSYTAMYYANGSQARTPGAYHKDKKHAAPGLTNEQVHPSVGFRMFATKEEKDPKLRYTPIGMDTDKFIRLPNASGGWGYSINGIVLPEYVLKRRSDFGGSPGYETLAIQGDKASSYVQAVYGHPIYEH
ncbi:uncharacterized protein N0V89_004037 [Didymosphaeria variabile]|uniref:T6SS Phospholipase effector Tle1-like catalytic domain-containing protein n=1 Tax=Didymosphaeria variabile TaxID=1932322 RepID=A0A9W8XQG4_9PLEO|nr:uncharacterized protein N0V89_004037 [Didymosphaeria variabile]KAJ4356011.1 hypothetical protein N0V89_004037 [Didymosphaeria variabile]